MKLGPWKPERSSRERPGAVVIDTIVEQVRELVDAEDPGGRLDDSARRAEVDRRLGDDPDAYGSWFWYPWLGCVVHVLPREEYRRLRSDRNRYRISPEEQAHLLSRKVGVVGLSVGQSAAMTLAMEGVGGHFRLADFDRLSLSNMNRLRAGVHELGVHKAVLAARGILALDPYLEVELFPRGLTDDQMDAFLDGLDLVVEECDDLYIKLRVRECARARGIPVVMMTSDRGLADVERFDLEPDRSPFHGRLEGLRAADLAGLTSAEKVPYALRILRAERLSDRLKASIPEIGKTIETWPQLASEVTLGGAQAANVARRILLGEELPSGSYVVDLDALVRGPSAS